MPSRAVLLAVLFLSFAACASDAGSRSSEILIVTETAPTEGVRLAADRFVELLGRTTSRPIRMASDASAAETRPSLVFALGRNSVTDSILPRPFIDGLAPESYALRRREDGGSVVLAATGSDTLGTQYAIYSLLEKLGFGFFHPEQTFVPESLRLPGSLDEVHEPDYRWRGFHVHTMHPIELMDSLLLEGEDRYAEAERYIEWLVANRQNYFQWALLDSVDLEAWLRHARRIVEHAHARGIRVGIDTPFRFVQQNAWVLIPDANAPWPPQIEASLGRVLSVPFDVVNVELGKLEFVPADDALTMDWLNFTADLLDRAYGVELLAKVHVTQGQTAPHFGGVNFNFLPGLADSRVGVMPHTVQFYDLYRRAPTYGNEDFSFMREFLLAEIGERRVVYYPETAYWVSFDIDVPLFLPLYGFSRWNDLNRLVTSGMDGEIDFSSGFEWGYWLGDWLAASSAFDAHEDWRAKLERFTQAFGPQAAAMQDLLVRIVDEQGHDLLEKNLIAYLIGWDTADDIGHYFAGTHYQPVRILPEEIRRMRGADLDAFQTNLLGDLQALDGTYQGFLREVESLSKGVPDSARPWYREIRDSLEVMSLRIRHVTRLYEGVGSLRRAELGLEPATNRERARECFSSMQSARTQAESVIASREREYRWPVDRIARRRENPTAYEFGYLYTVSDAYYWKRDEIRAFEPRFCICEGNLVNLVDTMLGEGVVGDWVEGLPRLGGCLDACVHPVARIRDPRPPDPEEASYPQALTSAR